MSIDAKPHASRSRRDNRHRNTPTETPNENRSGNTVSYFGTDRSRLCPIEPLVSRTGLGTLGRGNRAGRPQRKAGLSGCTGRPSQNRRHVARTLMHRTTPEFRALLYDLPEAGQSHHPRHSGESRNPVTETSNAFHDSFNLQLLDSGFRRSDECIDYGAIALLPEAD